MSDPSEPPINPTSGTGIEETNKTAEPAASPPPPSLMHLDAEGQSRAVTKRRKKTGGNSELGSARAVETMFRTSYRVHVDLTALADNKANIMISINGLIIPIMLFALVPLLEYNPWLIVPSTVLVITCLISIVYAVLSARPRINPNPVTRTSIEANRANILFFGNFSHLTESEYLDGMKSMMEEIDNIYLSMMRDIYGMGKVLSTKFALLKRAYTVFMVGLIVSIVLFLATFGILAMNMAA